MLHTASACSTGVTRRRSAHPSSRPARRLLRITNSPASPRLLSPGELGSVSVFLDLLQQALPVIPLNYNDSVFDGSTAAATPLKRPLQRRTRRSRVESLQHQALPSEVAIKLSQISSFENDENIHFPPKVLSFLLICLTLRNVPTMLALTETLLAPAPSK